MIDAQAAWVQLLGEDRVETAGVSRYGLTTHEGCAPVEIVLRARSRDEVVEVMKIATRFGVPLSVTSGGKNWGLGSRMPGPGALAILDLSEMNRILDVDERMATMTVEPGVTFRQAAAQLKASGSQHFLCVTGGPAGGSVVGNALERGDGSGPYGDRAGHVAGLEVVLGDGRFLRTGMARFSGSLTGKLDRYGVGPSLDGLFFQSGLGIVTAMTVWMRPRPQRFAILVFELPGARGEQILEGLALLALRGVVEPGCVALWSPEKVKFQLGGDADRWQGSVAFYAESDGQLNGAVDLVMGALGEGVVVSYSTSRDDPSLLDSAFFGQPSDRASERLYAPKNLAAPQVLDPDSDRVGLVWICIAAPLEGGALVRLMQLGKELRAEHLIVTFGITLHSARIARGFLGIHFDRDNVSAEALAVTFGRSALARFQAEGFYPFRLGHPSIGQPEEDETTDAVLRGIRGVLDPAFVLRQNR